MNPTTGEVFEEDELDQPNTFDATEGTLGERELAAQAALAEATAKATQGTARARKKLQARQARKDAAEASGESEALEAAKKAEKRSREALTTTLHRECYAIFSDHFDSVRVGWKNKWSVLDKKKAKELLALYEDDVDFVVLAWKNLCERWDFYKHDLKFKTIAPTIGILAGFRERLFGDVQKRTTKRKEIESRQLKSKFGWK